MSRLKRAVALRLLTAAALLSGCSENFATGPEKFPGNLDVLSWADTLVVGEWHTVTARVLDAQGREVLDRTIRWTIASPSVLGIALAAGGSSAPGGAAAASTLSVAGGVPMQLRTVALGASVVSLQFADPLFQETTVERSVTVVTAGVRLATASDTTLGAIGDTAIVVASALGRSPAGNDQPVARLGVTWTRQGPGAVTLIGDGDTVRVVAMQVGTDTLVVSHAVCLAGAPCADTLLVHVQEEGSEPPLGTLTLSPVSAEKAVNESQQFSVTAGGAGPYTWSVNGVDGGNGVAGPVTSSGLYTAPGSIPAGDSVQVCARIAATPAVTGCATVTVTLTPTLTLSPASAEKAVNQTQQFSITAGGAGPYTWSVNGVDGGNGIAGAVTSSGVYTAPGSVPAGDSVQVCARIAATPAVIGCATMTVTSGVTPTLTLSPASAEKAVNQTQQFEVTAGGAGPYLWSVAGVDGGNGTTGTVSADGLYIAPGAVPAGGTVEVCARVEATPAVTGCATVTVSAAPPSGADVIVINDIDMWSSDWGNTPGNLVFFANIVNYSGTGPRLAGKSVMYYIGANSLCSSACSSTDGYVQLLSSTLVSLGYTLIDESSTLTNIPADVKVIFIWLPMTTIGAAEVNALKQFASEGGRLVVVGENGWWYDSGIPVENQLLADLGSQLVNLGSCAWGGGVVESDHQLVAGVNELSVACASGMTPGPNDFVVVREPGTGVVIVAVTRIDLTPLE